MELTGKEAQDFIDNIRRENARKRAEALGWAKEQAALDGKEPFDLARLETMCDTSNEGRMDPVEERHARFEEMYYVEYPSVRTLAGFAEKVQVLNGQSLVGVFPREVVVVEHTMVAVPAMHLRAGLTPEEADRLALELARMEGALFDPGIKGFALFDLEAARARRREALEASMPAYEAEVGAFEIDAYPVTNAQWERFMSETGAAAPAPFDRCEERRFVTGISWREAFAYARHFGFDLPTELEWECAARNGRDFFPWGDSYFPQGDVAFCPPVSETYVVGTRPEIASARGVHDMIGQFGEYCRDAFMPYAGADTARFERQFPHWRGQRVVRGGYDTAQDATCVSRRGVPEDERRRHLKFRCVRRR